MQLVSLIKEIKDQHLDRQQLESYESELLDLYNQFLREKADIEKAKALFLHSCEAPSDVAKVRLWQITELGQREIEIEPDVKILPRVLSSLKNRIYRLI